MFDYTHVNWLAVIVGAVVGLVIGYAWFLPQVMGTRWAASIRITLPTRPNTMQIVGSIVGVLITTYVLALFINAVGANSLVNGAIVGFVAWLGFVFTWTMNGALFEGRSWEYIGITTGQGLVSAVVVGAILGAWH